LLWLCGRLRGEGTTDSSYPGAGDGRSGTVCKKVHRMREEHVSDLSQR
jgi:hypothetical protein